MDPEPVVPGEFECPECGFTLTKSFLHAQSGGVSRDTRDTMEPCPNDGTIMRPLTYHKALDESRRYAGKGMGFYNAMVRMMAGHTGSMIPAEPIADLILKYEPS